ncbi:MAG: TonB-dependent receptor [Pyrinomonadaceae bacterium]
MNRNFKLVSLVLSFILCLGVITFGQERTGVIEGTARDASGAVVPNATIMIEGNAFNRTVNTNDEGYYRVQQVPPGKYNVTVTAGSFQKIIQKDVLINLGQATLFDPELRANVSAEVTVTGEGVATIDPTSSKIQTNLGAERLETLPKGTNFTSALRAAAPVRPEPTGGGFQIDGASGSENTFVIDGQEVTNFRTGTLNASNNVPFQLVQEIQVKSNGFEAEYGGATGGVINVVTKRGSDDFHGEVGAQFDTPKFDAGPRRILSSSTLTLPTAPNRYIYPTRDSGVSFFPSFYIGGPVIKKHLYFFASHSPQFFNTQRDFTFTDGVTQSYRSDVKRDYSFLRLDGQVGSKLSLNATYLYNPLRQRGVIPGFVTLTGAGPSTTAPGVADQLEQGGRIPATNYTFEGTYTPTQNLVFNARYGRSYLNEKISNYGVPNIVNYTCSNGRVGICETGFALVPNNFATVKDISIRRTFDANVGLYVNNFGGRHSFRFGYQYNGLSNDVDEGYAGTGIIDFSFGGNTTDRNGCPRGNIPAGTPIPTGCSANPDPTALGVGSLTRFGTFGFAQSKNEGIFAQDSWQIGKRLTLNLGIRAERENVPSFKEGAPGIKFNFSDKIAPRLGVAFDILGNGKWKAFASYGWFYDRFKYELPRGSFGGDLFLVYDFVIVNPNLFSYQRDNLITNNINFTDFRTTSNDPANNRIDPDLKAFRQSEYTFGTAYDFGKGFIIEGRYTHKQIDRAIEDIGYHNADDDEEYFIGNPGFGVCAQIACGRYAIPGNPPAAKANRDYDAVEVRTQKRLGDFSLDASYTYSRLFGNYAGLASSDEAQRGGGGGRNSPNVNRNFDLPFIGYTLDGKPDDGRLPTDRPHYVKFAGSYTFNWFDSKANSTDFNVFYQIASGTPVTTRSRIAFVSGQIVSGRGDQGRTDRYSQTDFSISHKYRFGRDNRYAVGFDVNVLNLLNQATELSRRETITRLNIPPAVFGCPGVDPGFTPLRCIDRGVFNGTVTSAKVLTFANAGTNKDQRYNLPQSFQDPRNIRFGFRFIF